MFHSSCLSALPTAFGVAALLWIAPLAQAQAPPEGVEVLARGPVHEAYASSVNGQPEASPVVPKQPPEPIEELPPDQKPEGDNVQWIPGYWAFDEDRGDHLWISGFWRVPPPGRQWTPGHWKQADSGFQWIAGFWAPVARPEVTYLPPPPAPIEVAASVPAPSTDHFYVPGSWVYRETRYVWRPGFWCVSRPNWVWVPAHYVWSPCGYVFVDGYWDYTLRERGLLFAPVCIDVAVYRRPGFVYCPTYVVHDECLVGALFVRPGFRCYYFGDYYEPVHRRCGYVAWCDVRVGCGDPLFSYYRWNNRNDTRWEVSLRATYVGRYNGEVARPPRTLVQQNTVVKNITINNNTTVNNVNVNNTTVNNVNNVKNVTMIGSLNQVDKNVVKLQPVAPERRQEERKAAQQLVQASKQRGQTETQLLAKGPPPSKPTDAPRVAKLDLPKQPTVNPQTAKAPPPHPTHTETKPAPNLVKPELKPTPNPVHPDLKPVASPVKPELKPSANPVKPEGRPEPRPNKPETNPTVKPVQPMPVVPSTQPTIKAPQTQPTTVAPAPQPTVKPPQVQPGVATPQPMPQVQPNQRGPNRPTTAPTRPEPKQQPANKPKPEPNKPEGKPQPAQAPMSAKPQVKTSSAVAKPVLPAASTPQAGKPAPGNDRREKDRRDR
ncbi:MAG: hypothetical protein K2R98_07160 [Gemmataceae bacterium]|nr:hypothetical protein [Gemmataceae bacterium]